MAQKSKDSNPARNNGKASKKRPKQFDPQKRRLVTVQTEREPEKTKPAFAMRAGFVYSSYFFTLGARGLNLKSFGFSAYLTHSYIKMQDAIRSPKEID